MDCSVIKRPKPNARKTVTNEYREAAIAKWVFVALTVLTVGRSLAHIFLPDGGAQSNATIPLNDFDETVRRRSLTVLR